MNGKWFLFYTKDLTKSDIVVQNDYVKQLNPMLKLMPLKATTPEEAMIEAKQLWALITGGYRELRGSAIEPYIAQLIPLN